MAGRKHTNAQVEQRRAEVEMVLMAGEYSLSAQQKLARRHHVTCRQIQRDAAEIRAGWRQELETTPDGEQRADWMARVRAGAARALRDGHSMAAARLLQIEGDALGVYAPQQIEIKQVTNEDPRVLAQELLDALPMIHQVMGLPPPAPKYIDVQPSEADNDES